MAGRIPLAQIGDYIEKRMEQLLRVVVLDVDTRCKLESPVDTGRFRMSWQVGENATGFYDAGPQQPATGAFKDQSKPPKSPEATGLRKMNYDKETLGNVYSVHNNLPYAEPLANGTSRQAPAGWVQLIAKDAQSYAIAQAAKIGRES
jgi:hypothetical protein